MKKKYLTVIIFFTSILLTGCGSNVDMVKDGVMNFNKTITVGQAFDNWNNCKSSNWEEFETDNGMKIVQFTCSSKDVKEFMNIVKGFLPENEQKEASYLDVKSDTQIFQFSINKDDTFQIDNVQNETVWNDGKKYSISQKPVAQIENVYKNVIMFNLKESSEAVARQYIYPYTVLRVQAK